MRFLRSGISIFGIVIAILAQLANLVIGLINAFALFGGWAIPLGFLFFPITILGYPILFWAATGSGALFLIWGILWGVTILSGFIAGIGGMFSGED